MNDLLSSSDLTNFYVTLNSIKKDVEHIKLTVDKTDQNVIKIKDFIGYVENVSEAKPGIHEKFKGLYDRVSKLEHFRTWITTSCTIIVGVAVFIAISYYNHQKDFSIHKLESGVKTQSTLANK